MTITIDIPKLRLEERENVWYASEIDDWNEPLRKIKKYFNDRANVRFIDQDQMYAWLNLYGAEEVRRIAERDYAEPLSFKFGIETPVTVNAWFPTRVSRVVRRITVQ